MRLTAFFVLVLVFQVSAGSKAQSITLNLKKVPLKKVFKEITRQSGFNFVYNNSMLEQDNPVSIHVNGASVQEVLKICFKDQTVSYKLLDNTIIIVKPEELAHLPMPPPPITIIGKILDEDGKPIADVSILVKGSTTGTTTDANGIYSISISESAGKTLVFSSVGFETQEIAIGRQTEINISLRKKMKTEEAAVVVAFGKQKKISVVGSIDKISPTELKVPGRTISTSLAGRLAGVVAIQNSGEPGYDGATFWIRGINTFTGNQSPLILVDGVERSIDMIDPDEIADFTILKDATATAVYGVRGANGVVIVTTKRGSIGKPVINFRIENSFTHPSKLSKLVDGPTYMELQNEALTNTNRPPIFSQGTIDSTRSGIADPYYYPNVNWTKVLLKPWSTSQHATLNVSGGSDKSKYFVSAAFLNQNGMFTKAKEHSFNNNINLKRYNFRSNIDVTVTSSTQLGLTIAGSLENRNYPANSTQSIFDAMRTAAPTWYPIAYPDKTKIPGRKGVDNPWQMLAYSGYTTEYHSRLQSNFLVTQQLNFLTSGLSAKFNFSFDTYTAANLRRSMNPRKYLIVPQDLDGDGMADRDSNGNYTLTDAKGNYRYEDQDPTNSGYTTYLTREGDKGTNRNMYTELSLAYNRSFGPHSVGGLLLFNRNDYLDPSEASLFGSIPSRRQGLTGRTTYGFKDKYFLEFNFGYNGSENYAHGKRMGFFPSYAIGWVPSKEPFFEPMLNVINFLKIRLSNGKVGNDAIGNRFAYLTRVEATETNYGFGSNNGYGYGSGSGINITYYGNPDATWEIAQKSDLGLEVNFLKHFRLNADLFYEKRTNIWVEQKNVPDIYGFSSAPKANEGAMENKGLDGFLEYQQQFTRNLNITFKGTFFYGKNKVLATGDITPRYAYQSRIGQPFGRILGYVAQGLFADSSEILKSPNQSTLGASHPGDIKYKDINGDGKIDQFDQVFIGDPEIPEITFGFGSSVVYKNIDFSFLLQGASRISFIANPKPFPEVDRSGLLTIMEDRWSPGNPNLNAQFPRFATGNQDNNYVRSTHWLQNGAYMRLKQIELGYSFSSNLVKNVRWIKNLRVYANGSNLFTVSKFKWWDPESRNASGMYYPVQKVLNAGVDIKF